MPIKIPKNLPAFDILQNEGVMVMSSQLAEKQDIRPLQIILLNLMPEKIKTGNGPNQSDNELNRREY